MISDRITNTSPNENLNMVIPILLKNALLQFRLKLERHKLQKTNARHRTKCDVINDVKLFPQYIAGYTLANL